MKHVQKESKLGFACECGKRFTTEDKLHEHIESENILDQVAEELGGEVEIIEDTKPVKEAPVAEVKEEPKEVVEAPKALVPIQRVQSDIVKFASKMMSKERAAEYATRVALIARENPKIAQAINKNPDSFLASYMASVTLDLMPNTPEQLAFIIPYGDKVQFQTGYRGLIQLARRSGEIKTINAELVFEGDDFDIQFGTERKIVHKPDFAVNRTDYSKVTHAYATAKLTNDEDQFVVMTRDELNKVQKVAKAASTDAPWATWPERMALKTVLKRLAQVLPTSTDDDLRKAVAYDNLSEAGKLRFKEGEIIEGEVVEVSQTTVDAINTAGTREELNNILQGLGVEERKKAAPMVAARIKELG